MMEHGQDVKSLAWHPHEEVSLTFPCPFPFVVDKQRQTTFPSLIHLLIHIVLVFACLPSSALTVDLNNANTRSSHPHPTIPTST